LTVVLLSLFFIGSSRTANGKLLGRLKSRQRLPPCSKFHPLQTQPRIQLLTLLFDPSSS
jgi:hypothetical protein